MPTYTNPWGVNEFLPSGAATSYLVDACNLLRCAWVRPDIKYADNSAAVDAEGDYCVGRVSLAICVLPNGNVGSHQPAVYPTDLAAYDTGLLALVARYLPLIVNINNEANNVLYWASTATMQQAVDLQTHSYSTIKAAYPSVLVSDSGITSEGMATYLLQALAATGQSADALRLALTLYNAGVLTTLLTTIDQIRQLLNLAEFKGMLDKINTMFGSAYSTPPVTAGLRGVGQAGQNIDILNFHWYINDLTLGADNVANSTWALGKLVALLGTLFPGTPLMCNEYGQWTFSAAEVQETGKALFNLGVQPIIFFDLDKGKGKGLFYRPQLRPRPSGEIWRCLAASYHH